MLAGLRLVPRHARAAGSLILRYLGYAIPPAASSFLAAFFKDIFKINLKMDWERIWGRKAHSELQRRAISIRGNWAGSPSILVTTLDSFNDFLVQRFSRAHKRLKGPFRKAAGKKAKIPDFGTWLTNPALIAPLPNVRPVLSACHQLRVRAEIALRQISEQGSSLGPSVISKRTQ